MNDRQFAFKVDGVATYYVYKTNIEILTTALERAMDDREVSLFITPNICFRTSNPFGFEVIFIIVCPFVIATQASLVGCTAAEMILFICACCDGGPPAKVCL
jgi:hypothetical protein